MYILQTTNSKKKLPDIEILAQDKNILVSKLSISQIKYLADLDSIERITLPDIAVFDAHDVSEGVSFSMADEMHLLGFDGTGIKVAVIDDSFFTTNPEIISNIVHSELFDSIGDCSGDITCGEPLNGSHGTAVAEIVVDMAPGADLLLYAIGNSVDFNNAVDDATSRGADIITASLGFPTLGGDGSDPDKWFRDGTSSVAKKVNTAKDNGILFTVAAGNQGESHWSGTYAPNSTRMPEPLNSDLIGLTSLVGFVGYESVMIFNSTDPTTTINPIALYNFDGDVLDSSGNANHGTVPTGTPQFTAGTDGDAFDFDGSTHIQTTDAPFDFDRLDAFSVSAWFKTSVTGTNDFIFGKNPSGTGYQLFLKSDDQLRVRISNSNSNKIMMDTLGISVRDDNWHHVVLTYDGSSSASGVTIYIDGTAATLTTVSDNLTGTILNNEPLVIGNPNTTPGFEFTGQMDIFGIYDFELTADQVSELLVTDAMKACLPVKIADLDSNRIIASWNAWDLTTEDYDLILYGPNMIKFQLTGSFIPQDPDNLPPVESFSSLPGDACLVLAKFSGAPNLNHFFHIDLGANDLDPLFIVSSGSIDTPADATGALSVGAIDHSSDLFETFSSQGPTDDGRLKPEICGPDGTLTHQTEPPFNGVFFGTSASTPHVAGAAALLLDVNPNQTVDELKQKLIDVHHQFVLHILVNCLALNPYY